jgi:HupE / UreJ protein
MRSLSYSSWEISPEGGAVEVRLTALDASALAAATPAPGVGGDPLATYLAERLRLLSDGQPCVPIGDGPEPRTSAQGWRAYGWRLACPPGAEREIVSDLFVPENPAHLHFARVRLPGDAVAERVLAEGDRTWHLPRIAGGAGAFGGHGTTLLGYIALGIEHILTGWDHLAFVVALLLLARTLGELATLVTAFTVAHSVTLALATIGLLHPETNAVEALIGFSIALVAAENVWLLDGRERAIPVAVGAALLLATVAALLWPTAVTPLALIGLGIFSLCHFALLDRTAEPGRMRAVVAFAFGLIHGFGFAGVLAELELPRAQLAVALLGFNVGVEVGQLGVVAVTWPLLRLLSRLRDGRFERLLCEAGSAAICAVGLFWFVVRTFG